MKVYNSIYFIGNSRYDNFILQLYFQAKLYLNLKSNSLSNVEFEAVIKLALLRLNFLRIICSPEKGAIILKIFYEY